MEIENFNRSIKSASKFFEDLGLLDYSIYLQSIPRSAEFNKTALTEKSYTTIYEAGLSLSHFNFVLKDYSYFQFSHKSPVEWALAFYPNPRVTGNPQALSDLMELRHALEAGEISDEDYASLAHEFPAEASVPRVRFEYSKQQHKPVKHPFAHFHIGMAGDDRWCSARKISPTTFSMLMTRMYFPDAWWERSRFRLEPNEQVLPENIENCVDRKLIASLRADGVSQEFSDDERMGFHFAALPGIP